MPTLWVTVGIPGSGKSTWINKKFCGVPGVVVTGTDKFVEAYALKAGKTYSEVFNDAMPEALIDMVREVREAVDAAKDIVWDQTSTTRASRAKKLIMVPDNYTKIAVVFPVPESTELVRRLNSRPGKAIPPEIVQDMINGFKPPTLDEGFHEIQIIDSKS